MAAMSALNAPAPTVICFAEAAYPAANGLRTTRQPWADDRFSSAFAIDRVWIRPKDSGVNPANYSLKTCWLRLGE